MSTRKLSAALLALRSLLWTILMPGMVAGYVPWRFFGVDQVHVRWTNPVHLTGLLCIAVGALLLAACIFEFARSGKGTLSPADPPRELVVRGLYRHVRNPMYLSVSAILIGETLLTRSRDLLLYWAVFFLLANVFVIVFEEPMLRRQFGSSYEQYTKRVGRWLPRLSNPA